MEDTNECIPSSIATGDDDRTSQLSAPSPLFSRLCALVANGLVSDSASNPSLLSSSIRPVEEITQRQSEMYGFSWLPSFEHIIRFVESSGKQESQSLSSVVVASRKRELKSREGGVREKQHHASYPIVEMAPHDIVHGIVVEVGDQRLVVELTRWYCIFKDENRLVLPPSGSDVESSHIRAYVLASEISDRHVRNTESLLTDFRRGDRVRAIIVSVGLQQRGRMYISLKQSRVRATFGPYVGVGDEFELGVVDRNSDDEHALQSSVLFSDGDHHDSEDDDDCNGDNVEDNRISGLCDADAYENTLNGIAPVQTHFFPDLLVDRDSYWGNKDSSNQPLKHTKGLFSRLLLRDPLFANPNNVSLMTKGFGVYDRGSFLNIPPPDSGVYKMLRERQNRNHADTLVSEGVSMLDSNPNGAIQKFTEALEYDTKNVNALVCRGAQFANLSKWKQALLDLKAAVSLDPNHANGVAYLKTVQAKMDILFPKKSIDSELFDVLLNSADESSSSSRHRSSKKRTHSHAEHNDGSRDHSSSRAFSEDPFVCENNERSPTAKKEREKKSDRDDLSSSSISSSSSVHTSSLSGFSSLDSSESDSSCSSPRRKHRRHSKHSHKHRSSKKERDRRHRRHRHRHRERKESSHKGADSSERRKDRESKDRKKKKKHAHHHHPSTRHG